MRPALCLPNHYHPDGLTACSIKSACEAVKTKGTIVNVAIWEKPIPFDPNTITHRESSYKSVLGYDPEDFAAVIENLHTGSLLVSIFCLGLLLMWRWQVPSRLVA